MEQNGPFYSFFSPSPSLSPLETLEGDTGPRGWRIMVGEWSLEKLLSPCEYHQCEDRESKPAVFPIVTWVCGEECENAYHKIPLP